MYLDFEDHRPDVPRVTSPISAREGVLISLVLHLVALIFILLAPSEWFQPSQDLQPAKVDEPPMRYVQMMPAIDREELAKRLAEDSDQNRRSMTRERAPDPQNAAPLSRGNTPEKIEGAPEVRTAGPENNQPPQPAPPDQQSPPQADMGLQPAPESPRAPSLLASGNLGRDLRNPQRYLQNQNYENLGGGNTDQGADIQFDSKGVDFGPWLRRFTAQVRRNWLVPQVAELTHGDVVLQFFVLRNGTITDLRVVKPAAIDALTVSALNAIKLSNPAPSLPADYPDDRIQFTVHFYYNERIRE
jgi:TonB family protein